MSVCIADRPIPLFNTHSSLDLIPFCPFGFLTAYLLTSVLPLGCISPACSLYLSLQGSWQAQDPSQLKPKKRRVQFLGFPEIPDSPLPTPVEPAAACGTSSAAEAGDAAGPHDPVDPHDQDMAPSHPPASGDALFGLEEKPLSGVRYCFLGFRKDDPVCPPPPPPPARSPNLTILS